MVEIIVIAVSLLIVWGLIALEREPGERGLGTLWIPLIWCLINGSRQVSTWLFGSSTDASRFSEGTPLDAAISGAMILAGLLILNRRARLVSTFIQSNWHILLFYTYCALSISWSDFPYVAAKRWIKLVGDLVMVLLIYTDVNPMWAIRRVFSRSAFVLVTFSVTFILFLPDIGTSYDPQANVMYYNGVTTQKNELGETCLIAALASLWLLLGAIESSRSGRRSRQIAVYAGVMVTSLWLIMKADSMTSFTAFVLAGAVMILAAQRWLITTVNGIHALMGSAIALAAATVFLDAAGPLLQMLGRTSTFTGRTAIWSAVLAARTNPLLGAGYESFWLGDRLQFVWDVTNQHIQQAHNGYLEIYINLGWLGVACLAVLIMVGYKNAVASFYRDQHFGRLALGFLVAILIHNFSEAGFRMMTPIWFGFLFAISGAWGGPQAAQSASPAQAGSLGRVKVLS